MSALTLPCDECGRELARDVGRGWVSWWFPFEGGKLGDVVAFHVTCGAGAECSERLERRMTARGLRSGTDTLRACTGERAMFRLQEIVWSYPFARGGEPMRRCFDVFLVTARIFVR